MVRRPLTRRELFCRSGGLTLPFLIGGAAGPAAAAPAAAPDVYTAIGVRPFLNARGTYTILSGSLMLPEVHLHMGHLDAVAHHAVAHQTEDHPNLHSHHDLAVDNDHQVADID
jgi:hypothetical protein